MVMFLPRVLVVAAAVVLAGCGAEPTGTRPTPSGHVALAVNAQHRFSGDCEITSVGVLGVQDGILTQFSTSDCRLTHLGRTSNSIVQRVNLAPNGDILSLTTPQAGDIAGDLFVDCTGFKALLIGETLGVPFRKCDDVLFCDRALAIQVPYASDAAPIASQTISTAQSSGWIWDIGLPARRGVGHVYSSRHISDDEAERELRDYLGGVGKDLPVRKLVIPAGHRETFWKRNCVAVGLAAGFLEPLEASAIVLIELSAKFIAEQMPVCREVMDLIAARFNSTTQYRWGRIIDFLKLHYVLTKRTDTPFWRDNLLPETIPDRLQDLLLLWSHQSPWFHDEFDRVEEVFPAASYQYVLYGMGFRTQVEPSMLSGDAKTAERAMRENAIQTEHLRAGLPRHRDLIRKIVEHGMQAV